MKSLSLLLLVCMVSMLAFAQTDSSANQTQQELSQDSPAGGVTLSPASSPASRINLGNQPLGSTAFTSFILNNAGPSITVTKIVANSPYSVYHENDTCPPVPFQLKEGSGNWCLILLEFQASAAGENPGTLTVSYNPTGTQTAYLNATGIYAITFVPNPGPLGVPCNVNIGTHTHNPGPCTVNLTNQLPVPLSISIQLNPLGDFTQLPSSTCESSVPAFGSCTIVLAFSDNAPGGEQGTLTVTTNPATSPQTLNLLGCRKYGC